LFDLFDAAWEHLDQADVERFLRDAGDEGVTWEAKGASPKGESPHPESLRKAACGLANQIGGYLIVGANQTAVGWRLEGIAQPAEEPVLWLGQILRGLQPTPRFQVAGPFAVGEERIALVARIEPVAISPCMTPQGRIYERVSGETLPVQDPTLLERLFRRGEQTRSRAEHFARRAAERAIDLPDWIPERSVSLCVGLSSVGHATEDISSRLFTEATHDLLVKGIWELHGDVQPISIDLAPTQDSYVASIDSQRHQHFEGDVVTDIFRTSYFIQANWDGSVAAGVWSSDDFPPNIIGTETLLSRLWSQAAEIGAQLGGYGPSHLSIVVVVAKGGEVGVLGRPGRPVGRPPHGTSGYSRLPAFTRIDRALDTIETDNAVIESIGREIQRAGGVRADEPG
jgi:hypothetical protein